MDLLGVVGLFLSFGSLIIFGMKSISNLPMFLDTPSFFIVFVCSLLSLLLGFPLKCIKTMFGCIKYYVIDQKHDIATTISQIIGFAEQARREGILALENSLENVEDPFLKKGIQLAVDGTEKAVIESILEAEKTNIEKRHKFNIAMIESLMSAGPTYGMMGTVVGLVLMLRNMSDPSSIGPAMAIALITTFYGSILANMFAWPIASKLRCRHDDEMTEKQIMLDGILSVQAGENPRIVQWKLSAYLDPRTRAELEAAKESERGKG